jgi:hypothetical protein
MPLILMPGHSSVALIVLYLNPTFDDKLGNPLPLHPADFVVFLTRVLLNLLQFFLDFTFLGNPRSPDVFDFRFHILSAIHFCDTRSSLMSQRIAQASLPSLSRTFEMPTQLMMEDPEGPEVNHCDDKGTGIDDHGIRVLGRRAETSWRVMG